LVFALLTRGLREPRRRERVRIAIAETREAPPRRRPEPRGPGRSADRGFVDELARARRVDGAEITLALERRTDPLERTNERPVVRRSRIIEARRLGAAAPPRRFEARQLGAQVERGAGPDNPDQARRVDQRPARGGAPRRQLAGRAPIIRGFGGIT